MDDLSDPPTPRRPIRNIPPRAAKIKTPVRQTRSTAAYFSAQSSPGEDPSDESDESPPPVVRTSPRKRKLRNVSSPVTPKRPRQRSHTFKSQPEPPADVVEAPAVEADAMETDAANDVPGKSPPWLMLPYLAWKRIFEYVADPIREDAARIEDVTEAVYSLLSAARACRVMMEPALASLYKCPPFHQPYFTKNPHASFLQFVETLHKPPTSTIIRYRPKVEILRVDTDIFLSRKQNGRQASLRDLAHNLPRLSDLELYHPFDDPPYRELDHRIRWHFSEDDLFETFAPVANGDSSFGDKTTITQLQSWRWNSRLAPEAFGIENLAQVHLNPSFASLRRVAYVNYQLPSWGQSTRLRDSPQMRERDQRTVVQFADSISALPNLEHLIIESSTLANGSLLGRLPKTLKHLELINCWEIISEDLAEFLATHGNSLRKLTLKHCQSLSLSFLPILGASCPDLTHLDVDLSYFQHHDAYRDNKPEYASLLEEDQVPTWPASMQSITIIHMRNWSLEAAEMFFQSLIRSARDLPHLRRLEFKVILDIAWRQRQELRKSLVEKMTRIFKKRVELPKELETLDSEEDSHKSLVVPIRRSTRIADKMSEPNSPEGCMSATNRRELPRISSIGKNLRKLRIRQSICDADDEDSEDELAAGHMNDTQPLQKQQRAKKHSNNKDEFIHGLCEIVDIQVDNKRPMERQYEMDDFIDSPEESDPEWDGEDSDEFE
ncbi:hypothetical protein F5X96DRAFT_618261 [Biscogniauxia mediterranea]|nr:hypothetical protein F5X96DRAFT_618261 [Biscogniauxia mediterranea]